MLRQGLVEKARQQHGVAIGTAQRHGLGGQARFASLGLVATEEIGLCAALPGRGTRSFVEIDARHQQRGEGIHDSGFAGPDIAGQKRVVAVRVQPPDVLVEGPPVQHFEADQTKAGSRTGESCFRPIQVHPPSLCTRTAGGRTRPATAHPRTTSADAAPRSDPRCHATCAGSPTPRSS